MNSNLLNLKTEPAPLALATRIAVVLALLGTAACGSVDGGTIEDPPEENVAKAEQAVTAAGYLAVWRPGTGAQWWRSGMSSGQFVQEEKDMRSRGFRIRSVDVYTYKASCGTLCTESRHQYTAVFEPGSGTQRFHYGMSNSAFASRAEEYLADGLRVTALAVSATGKITAVWRPGTGKERTWAGISGSTLEKRNAEYWNDGLQMEQLVSYDGDYYAKWGPKHSGHYFRFGMSPSEMKFNDNQHFAAGYRIRSLDLRNDSYVAIWDNESAGAQFWNSGLTPAEMRTLDQERFKKGLRLKVLRVRKYDYSQPTEPEPPNMSGMDPTPPAGNTCSAWAMVEIINCANADGSPGTVIKDGQVTHMACGSTTTNARNNAKAGLQAAGFCLVDSPYPNCCTYRYR